MSWAGLSAISSATFFGSVSLRTRTWFSGRTSIVPTQKAGSIGFAFLPLKSITRRIVASSKLLIWPKPQLLWITYAPDFMASSLGLKALSEGFLAITAETASEFIVAQTYA